MTTHPRLELNEQLTNPIRLSVVAAVMGVDEVDFKSLREALDLTDSTLSKTASALEGLGYLHIRKGFVGKRPRTWISATPAGRAAFQAHVDALRRLTGGL